MIQASGKFLKKLRSMVCVASTPEDNSPETDVKASSEKVDERSSQTSYDEWSHVITEKDLLEAYDTVIEIHEGSPYLESSDIRSVADEVLIPGDRSYDEPGESIEALRDKLDGNSLVVAFGFDGEELPNYTELLEEDIHHEGNWWDNPEELDTDYLFDRTTYTGAVNSPGTENRHVFASDEVNRDAYIVDLS